MAKPKCEHVIRPGRGSLPPLLCGEDCGVRYIHSQTVWDTLCPIHRFREDCKWRRENEEMKGV